MSNQENLDNGQATPADPSNAQLFTIQVYTPGSDVAVGFQPSQILWGRDGNNTLLGYQPLTPNPNQPQIDIVIGGTPIVSEPKQEVFNNTYILGDWREPYYANGNPNLFGLNDFALIVDFNPAQDTIQLHGTPQDYQLVNVGVGEALLWEGANEPDVIGVLLGNSGLSLNGNYFDYVGSTPPSGLVLPQTQQLGAAGGFTITTGTTTDPSGNVYTVGGTTGSIGTPNIGSRDALIAKYDSQGDLLWTKQFGTSSFDTVYSIATDNQGSSYIAGITEGDLATPLHASTSDAFIAKYDSNGNQQWIQQFGQNEIFQTYSIAVDSNSNAYLSGLDVYSSSQIASDRAWVAKYNTNGNQQWLTEIGPPDTFTESYGVTTGRNNDVYATGWTLGNLAGQNAGLYDAWVAKYDGNTGQPQWIRQFGSSEYDWSWSAATDSQDNVYATGWTLGDLGGKNTGNSYDAWLAKYDSQGNQQWIKQFGDGADTEAFRTYTDSKDDIFLTGYTNGNLGGQNAGSFDAWVAEYDTNGNQKWIKQFGTPQNDQGYSITGDNAGNLYVTGITEGSLGSSNSGSFDSWLAKLNASTGTLEAFSSTSKPVNASSTSTAII